MTKSISAAAVALALACSATLVARSATEHTRQQKPPAFTPIPAPDNVAKPPANASKTSSGLAFLVLQPGTGKEKPGPADVVTVNYTGWTTDGKMFDSSFSRPTASSFPLDRVIKGWGEGVQLMVAGEKRRFWIPQELAYNGTMDRPAGMLVFDIELIAFKASPTAPPPDVAAPPKDAKRTASGLAFKSLREGKGGARPTSGSTVTVHYTGWTTDGKMFDSSVVNRRTGGEGQPISFPLGDVIAGWTEGLQLMTAGEKMRFWIPERLAYKGERPPLGMLVFDVELIAFK